VNAGSNRTGIVGDAPLRTSERVATGQPNDKDVKFVLNFSDYTGKGYEVARQFVMCDWSLALRVEQAAFEAVSLYRCRVDAINDVVLTYDHTNFWWAQLRLYNAILEPCRSGQTIVDANPQVL